jgi:hypothetical protein
MVEDYYIRWRGNVSGPHEFERLQTMVLQGQVSRLHEISADRATWTQAQDVEALFPSVERPSTAAGQSSHDDEIETVLPEGEEGWYCAIDEEVMGPYSDEQIRLYLQEGRIATSDWVSPLGNPTDWSMVCDVPHLISAIDDPG